MRRLAASHPCFAVVPLLLALAASGAPRAEEAPAEWAAGVALHLKGGPPAGTLRIRLNGESVAEIGAEVPPRIEIARYLVAGVNRLELDALAPETPPREAHDLEVVIARPGSGEEDNLLFPLVRSRVAASRSPEACSETIPFWTGPNDSDRKPPTLPHWVVARGPASGHRVVVVINDRPVFSTTSGGAYTEVSRHVGMGRNEIEFDAVPSCLAGAPVGSESFSVSLMLGWREMDRVNFVGGAVAHIEIRPDEPRTPFSRSKSFKAQ